MVLEMEKGYIIIMMEKNMKETLKRAREKEKEYTILPMEMYMMEIGKKAKEMEKG